MTDQFSSPTPDEARRALSAAETTRVVTSADTARLQRGTLLVVLAISGLIVAMRLTTGNHGAPRWLSTGGFWVSITLYIGVILLGMLVFRKVRAMPRGFMNRYAGAFMVSMAIYLAYVLVQADLDDRAIPWPWTIATAVAAAIPGLVAVRSIRTLGR